jgi:hypothetical protein
MRFYKCICLTKGMRTFGFETGLENADSTVCVEAHLEDLSLGDESNEHIKGTTKSSTHAIQYPQGASWIPYFEAIWSLYSWHRCERAEIPDLSTIALLCFLRLPDTRRVKEQRRGMSLERDYPGDDYNDSVVKTGGARTPRIQNVHLSLRQIQLKPEGLVSCRD